MIMEQLELVNEPWKLNSSHQALSFLPHAVSAGGPSLPPLSLSDRVLCVFQFDAICLHDVACSSLYDIEGHPLPVHIYGTAILYANYVDWNIRFDGAHTSSL